MPCRHLSSLWGAGFPWHRREEREVHRSLGRLAPSLDVSILLLWRGRVTLRSSTTRGLTGRVWFSWQAHLADRSMECRFSASSPFSQSKPLIFGKRGEVRFRREKITWSSFDSCQPPFLCLRTSFLSGMNVGFYFSPLSTHNELRVQQGLNAWL